MFKSKLLLGTTVLTSVIFLGACGNSESASNDKEEINLAYVEWDSEIASTYVVGHVLEEMGYDVKLTPLDNAIMWEAISTGEADAMVSGWLPTSHAAQYERYGDQIIDLGVNLEGGKMGLVVPSYMDVDSIEDLSDEAEMTITGIEAGAGIMSATETAFDSYSNLADWSLLPSSSGAMTVALDQAIQNEEEIIITGWSPHWKFVKYDLKYLDDPQGIYGGVEYIHTFVREGLEEDLPKAYKMLDTFNWTTEDMESVMLDISEGMSPEDAAEKWVTENESRVAEWKQE